MSIVQEVLSAVTIGEPVVHENLAMFPLLGGKPGEPPYHTLREALDAGTVEVTEVSEGGSVPRLALANRGDKPVLVVDGEELVGAKQNRVLNITILAPAGKTTVLPVSCVEQGRWGYRSRTFEDHGRVLFHKARAAKAAHVSECRECRGSSDSDQGEVWSHIADKMATMSVRSASHAMEDIYTSHAPRLEAYAKAIRPVDGAGGGDLRHQRPGRGHRSLRLHRHPVPTADQDRPRVRHRRAGGVPRPGAGAGADACQGEGAAAAGGQGARRPLPRGGPGRGPALPVQNALGRGAGGGRGAAPPLRLPAGTGKQPAGGRRRDHPPADRRQESHYRVAETPTGHTAVRQPRCGRRRLTRVSHPSRLCFDTTRTNREVRR